MGEGAGRGGKMDPFHLPLNPGLFLSSKLFAVVVGVRLWGQACDILESSLRCNYVT
jgi:hypothetical protein